MSITGKSGPNGDIRTLSYQTEDPKFIGRFSSHLFERAKTRLAFTTAHHPSANSQAEPTNQTFEHAIRCAIGERFDLQDWDDLKPYIEHALNTSINAATQTTPYALLYSRDPKPIFLDGSDTVTSETTDFIATHEQLRAKATDAVKLAQAKMKLWYDDKNKKPQFTTGWAYIRLAKPGSRGYHLQNQTKLSHNKTGPYRILEVNPLSCKIELPDWLSKSR
jgi:hypothetical protein